MKIDNNHASQINLAYIGGGSRGWAWNFMSDLALDPQMCGTVRLYDIDRYAAENNQIIGTKISAHPNAVSRWEYQVSDTLQEALTGADFVIISILPGTFREMHSDVHTPEKYGIYQSVGDTTGPGGLFRALRTIPMYVTIAEAIRQYAPDAWVINYTNPMAICLNTLYTVYPDIQAFGCCHEVFGTQGLLARMAEQKLGIESIPRQDITVNVLGLNHFTWLNSAQYRGHDLMPLYRDFVDQYYESGYTENDEQNWMNACFECAHRVKFDLFRRYGWIAAAGDRHLAEFMPPIYLRDPETVRYWKFGLTTVDWREGELKKKLDRSAALVSGAESVTLADSHEEGHLLMKAILGLGDMISNVNLPNRGQIENLPRGIVVETNAVFRAGSVTPVVAGSLPPRLLGLISRHAANQADILRAVLEDKPELAFAAFMNDPLVQNLTLSQGRELFNDMLHNTAAYLPTSILSWDKRI